MLTKDGILIIGNEDTIKPGLLEVDFLASSLGAMTRFNGANDGYSRYSGSGPLEGGLICYFALYFYDGILDMVIWTPKWPGTGNSWAEWSEEEELRVKELNDRLLEQYLGPPPYSYAWGSIESDYDMKGGSSGIVMKMLEKEGINREASLPSE